MNTSGGIVPQGTEMVAQDGGCGATGAATVKLFVSKCLRGGMETTVLVGHGSPERLPGNPQTVPASAGAKNTIKKIMKPRKSEINFFFSFFM